MRCAAAVLVAALAFVPQASAAPAASDSAYLEDLLSLARGRELSGTVQWRRLGYWRRQPSGGLLSEIDGPGFFLSARGAGDPEAELEATLRGFFEPAGDDQHPRCRFPARYRFLARELAIDPERVPQKACPKQEAWIANLAADSITLVFSSYYLGNAASAFGHTFLRVNRKASATGGERQALLDTGINYAAEGATGNAIIYGLRGLLGMFQGRFTALPYFYKVREYNDFEWRDLWEYELELSASAVAMLLDHLWELGPTYFDYWYLSENCSYHILTTLEAAEPRLNLIARTHWPVIPADTIKAVMREPGLVRKVEFRPSARTQLAQRLATLDGSSRAWVDRLADDPTKELPEAMSMAEKVRVFDAAADLIDVRFAKELVHTGKDTEGARRKNQLLGRRAVLGVVSEPLVIEPPWQEVPHRGHDSRRLAVGGGGTDDGRGFFELRLRLALHDLADPSRGFPDTTRLEFLPTRVRHFVADGTTRLEDIYLVRAASLGPMTRFSQPLSWKMEAGMRRVEDGSCDDCPVGHFELGGGLTLGSEGRAFLLFAMADMAIDWGPDADGIRDSGLRLGLGPSGGLRLRLHPELIALFTGSWHWLPDGPVLAEWMAEGGLRWQFADQMAMDLAARLGADQLSATAAWMIYF